MDELTDDQKLYNIAREADRNSEMDKAIKYYKASSELGNDKSHYALGSIYYNGKGFSDVTVQCDYELAKKHYLLSAEQGNSSALCNLGCMFFEGVGVKKDEEKAIEYFMLAFEKGNFYACNNLGAYYFSIKEIREAFKWFFIANKNGIPGVSNKIKSLLEEYWFLFELIAIPKVKCDQDILDVKSRDYYDIKLYSIMAHAAKDGEQDNVARIFYSLMTMHGSEYKCKGQEPINEGKKFVDRIVKEFKKQFEHNLFPVNKGQIQLVCNGILAECVNNSDFSNIIELQKRNPNDGQDAVETANAMILDLLEQCKKFEPISKLM